MFYVILRIIFGFNLVNLAFSSPVEINEKNLEELILLNPMITNNQEKLRSAEFLKGKLARSFIPKFGLSYGQELFSTGPYDNITQAHGGISAEVNLFNSGKDQIDSEMRDKKAMIARLDSKIGQAQILAELRKAMAHFAFLTELKLILGQAKDQNEINMLGAKKRINAGLATNTDILDFKQQKIQIEQEVSTISYEIGVTNRLINILIGIDPNTETSIIFNNSHPDHSDEANIKKINKTVLIQKAELFKNLSELETQYAKKWWAPSFDIYGYAQRFTQKEREYSPDSERNDLTIGFKFTFPFIDGGEGRQNVNSSQALFNAQAAQLKSQELTLDKDIQDALKKLELAHQLIHGAEENAFILSEYRKGILAEYSKGIKNSPDVLQANQRWIDAQMRHAEVKKNYQIARADSLYLAELQQ